MDDVASMIGSDWPALVVIAAFGTVLLTGVLISSQLAGWTRMDVPLLLGSTFVADPDRARVVGFVLHVLNGVAFALLYAVAGARTGWVSWWSGLLFGLFLGLVSLVLFVPLLSGINPRMASIRSGPDDRTVLEPPGLLGLNYGTRTPVVTLGAHLVYGALLGISLRTLIGT